MVVVRGLEDTHTLMGLVDGVLFCDQQGRHDLLTVGIDESNLCALANTVRRHLIRGERNGYRPKQTTGRFHAITNTLPIGPRHETIERGEAADSEHDQVADLP